ncbi:MAG: dockerin type I repeat-containing protein, partial [Verrucomicrobiota bacterium]|nr:dockerin type I repeat-containing protein [Verrucomicrobiota bacterium]
FSNGVNGDKVGVSAGLNSLGNNGGPTDTCSLLGTSVAINMGKDALAPSTDQRAFGRNGTSDIGAFESNGIAPPVSLLRAASRKTHGTDVFDINLALSGTPTVESRTGGAGGDHTLVFTFSNTLSSVGGATVTSGVASVSSSGIGFDAHEFIVNVTGAQNAQAITVGLTNVTDSLGHTGASVSASLGLLLGDANGDAVVNSADATITRNRSGLSTGATNFRVDYNLDGSINSADATAVRSRSGTFIP